MTPRDLKIYFLTTAGERRGDIAPQLFRPITQWEVMRVSRTKERELIKRDLLKQLEIKGATQKFYTSLVDDYLSLWDMKNALIADIEERGVSIEWNNGGGQRGQKRNDSIAELNKTNAQMLKILSELGLRGADVKVVDIDDEL